MPAATSPGTFAAGLSSQSTAAPVCGPWTSARPGVVARSWLALAVGSLVVAGLLSLAVVVGRLPVISAWIGDPLFFRRCLVVHVDLALVVWFYAFVGGLFASGVRMSAGHAVLVGPAVAAGGVGAMLAGALVRGAEPVLANYVPVIDHPLFLAGLALFFAGLLVSLMQLLASPAIPGRLPEATLAGLRAAAVAILLAGATWVSAVAGLPPGLDTWTRFEFTAWGPGHVLQVANTCAMLAVWFWLLERATGRPVLGGRAARVLMTLLVAPHFAMPLLTVRGTLNNLYHDGATQLMRWGIFPVVLLVLVIGVRHLWRHRGGDDARGALLTGLGASAGLAVLGMILGACIRGSNTLVPAHYHASLGAVTAAFMAAAHLATGARRWRAVRGQLALFGLGQAVFALGFAIGGAHGLGRKEYASDQYVRGAGEHAGLIIMGLGGLVAVAGGVWFLVLVVRRMSAWWRPTSPPSRSLTSSSP